MHWRLHPNIYGTLQGLAPTLIVVRVEYDRSADSIPQMMSIHLSEELAQDTTEPAEVSVVQGSTDLRPGREKLEAWSEPEGDVEETRAP